MRGLGGFTLFLIVLLVALIWAVTIGPWRDSSVLRQFTSPGSPQTASKPEPPKESETAAKAKKARASRTPATPKPAETAAESTVEAAPPAPAPAPAPPAAPARFPTAADAPAGTLGSRLLETFGPPVARTLAVDESGRMEIFIYRRSDPDTVTVVHVRNGRVISAVTLPY